MNAEAISGALGGVQRQTGQRLVVCAGCWWPRWFAC